MDIRTDSVNDILCHYGITPGTGRDYINGIITHGLFGIPTEREKAEMVEKQRMAELRLYNSKAEKLTSDVKKLTDDILTHYSTAFFKLTNKQSAADKALAQLYAAQKSGNVNKITALESKAKTIVNDVNRDITEWYRTKDSLIKQVPIYDSRVTNLINDRPNNNYSETLYTSQAVEDLQYARNILFANRDLLKDTNINKITM